MDQKDRIAFWKELPVPAAREGLVYPLARENGERLCELIPGKRLVYEASYVKMGLETALRRCYVRQSVGQMLARVLSLLPEEYGLWIYDTLRPVSVQQELFDRYRIQIEKAHPQADEAEILRILDDFVARPRIDYEKPTPHSTGGAVDLTLSFCGKPLDMGTGFDDLTEKAGTGYFEDHPLENTEALRNRRLLYHAMTSCGFVNYRNEWWHYSFGDRAWGAQNAQTPCYSCVEAEKGCIQTEGMVL